MKIKLVKPAVLNASSVDLHIDRFQSISSPISGSEVSGGHTWLTVKQDQFVSANPESAWGNTFLKVEERALSLFGNPKVTEVMFSLDRNEEKIWSAGEFFNNPAALEKFNADASKRFDATFGSGSYDKVEQALSDEVQPFLGKLGF